MVHINRVYTRSGDDGTTGLGDGSRVEKTSARIQAMGRLDELNSAIGVAISFDVKESSKSQLLQVQQELFDIGASLCFPPGSTELPPPSDSVIARLESEIDAATDSLEPLNSFILPGGTQAAAFLHHARSVCRATEICLLELNADEPVDGRILKYVNRLSDLLFVLARLENDYGRGDVLWKPASSS